MTSISIAVAVAILTFGSGLLGLYLQKRLPQTHLSGGSKDMILAVIGLLTLLLALVLGTLVGNTYASFAMSLRATTSSGGARTPTPRNSKSRSLSIVGSRSRTRWTPLIPRRRCRRMHSAQPKPISL